MKIDIVMTYYNRLDQLRKTLTSIQVQEDPDYEVIIVDDASDSNQAASLILNEYKNMRIRIIRIEPETKTWMNPCIPYNRGFAASNGEIVIIQNPECVHKGKVLKYVRQQMVEGKYLTIPCYSLTKEETDVFLKLNAFKNSKSPGQWFNHSKHNPSNLHFCSAIMRTDLNRVGGFDERFANGYCFDDNFFLWKVKKTGLNVTCLHPSNGVMVYHLWHTKARLGCCPEWHKNKALFEKIKSGEI